MFIGHEERADIANKNKADLFMSVHTNALPGGKQAYGMETYTLGMHRAGANLDVAKRENAVILIEKDYKQSYQGFNPNSAESYIMFEFMQDRNMANSVDLAKMVQRETCSAANRPDKGVHSGGVPRVERDVDAQLPHRTGLYHHARRRAVAQRQGASGEHRHGYLSGVCEL